MAKMPRGAGLIYNPSSSAPGFYVKNVFTLPGVPAILQSMMSFIEINEPINTNNIIEQ